MRKRLTAIMAAALLSISLTACGSKDDGLSDVTEATENVVDTEMLADLTETTESEEEEEVLPEGMYRSELTNELIDESLKNQRPIAAMVDNESIALPHYGMSQADVVYELMNSTLNGRITRFMVLVKDWDKIEQLGSIRSVRPTNVILASEWNAILCHDGGPFYNDKYFEEPWADHFSGTFSRVDNGKKREYTEYIVKGDLQSNFERTEVPKEYTSYYEGPHYQFASEKNPVDLSDMEGVIDAKTIKMPFPHNGSYLEYNEEDQLYYYYEYDKAHVDPGNGNAQLCFKNLLIQSCGYTQLDEHGYMIFDCYSPGYGYYITNGKAIYVSWKKESMTSPTRYYDSVGNEITLNTGKTYVGFVPVDDFTDLVIE